MLIYAGTTAFELTIETNGDTLVYRLVDLDEGRSITNNAELVIQRIVDINGIIPQNALVIYRDTTGRWDKILVENSVFIGFAPLGEGLEV